MLIIVGTIEEQLGLMGHDLTSFFDTITKDPFENYWEEEERESPIYE